VRPVELRSLVETAWKAELGLDNLPDAVPFFDLGGDSLGALRLAERLEAEVNVEVDLLALVDADGVVAFSDQLVRDLGLQEP
jgi:acyl carrier protein